MYFFRRTMVALLAVAAAALSVGEVVENCPEPTCECLELFVDCSRKKLEALPAVPTWAEQLDLAGNDLNDIAVRDLDKLVGLTHLNINNNRLQSIPPMGTAGHLEELNLNGNYIKSIEVGSFPSNSSLKVLQMNNNGLDVIQKGALTHLTHLTTLKLNRNKVMNLPTDLFKNLTKLKILDLHKNNLRKLKYHMFQGLYHLTELKLDHNNINNISDGAFFGFKVINYLRLDHNKISVVSKAWMYGLESLAVLSLSYNNILQLDFDCWERSSKLKELDLSYNKIISLDGRTLKHLINLNHLNLSGNNISSILQDTFSHTPLLYTLQLDNNKISWTVEDMVGPFSKLHNLHKFNLSSNHIQSIHSRAFEGLSKVEELDLRGNNITTIQQHAFETLTSIRKFHLNGSTLLCCNLQWISKWIRSKVDPRLVSATCAYPDQLRGRSIIRLKHSNCGDSPKPKVIEHPKSQKAIKGNSTHLLCTATSTPFSNMTFLWKKNNSYIVDPVIKVNTTLTDKGQKAIISELVIPNVTHSDDGKYQCLVSNNFGTTYSKKAEIEIVIFPSFTKIPMNLTVRIGETARLNCAATGDPSPEISWKKDGGNDFPAARERRMNVMPADHMFFIVGAKTDDMGIYSCAAKNLGGTIVANATLSVLEPPSVSRHVERKEVSTGEEVVIQCMISGSPKPELKWTKDGEPIEATDRHFFTAEDQLLVIVKAESSDAGRYECQISNSLGEDRGLTELSVISAVEDMTGIIIITVVCCAVGTSIVWVVIIYQTRRKMASAVPAFPTESIMLGNMPVDSETGAPMFSDTASERSSCKDSGTGDSAKQASFDGVPTDRSDLPFEPGVATRYSPVSEAHKLLPSSFKPTIQVCVNTSVSPATYSFSSHSENEMS